MGRKHKTFKPEDKDETAKKIKALRKKIDEQAKEITRLQSELRTLNKAFAKSAKYMSDESKDLTPEELIKAANNHQTLAEAKTEANIDEKERVRREFAEWRRKLPIPKEEE